MHILFSLLYAPFVFLSLRYFDLKVVSSIIFTIALIWFLIAIKKSFKESIFPLFYIIVAILAFSFDNFLLLKSLPLLISILVSLYFFYSYFTKNSFILLVLDRLKKEIATNEKEYIQKSTLFWCIISIINILIHIFVLQSDNINYWIYYSSIGWYFVFVVAFILQMIHKKIYLKKDTYV